MGRPPLLVRIVADLGSLLPAIESFDGGVHIQNPLPFTALKRRGREN
jgi:hypothetical protein